MSAVSAPRKVSISYDDGTVVLRCRNCGSSFSPGAGKPIPSACLGCRVPYELSDVVRHALEQGTGYHPAAAS